MYKCPMDPIGEVQLSNVQNPVESTLYWLADIDPYMIYMASYIAWLNPDITG